MITYRNTNYKKHVASLVEIDLVEQETPLRVRAILSATISIALRHLGKERGSVLDAGCRLGWLADFLQGTPWTYEGFDVNPDAVRSAQAKGRAVYAGPPRSGYDLVYFRQVLQYLDDVKGWLRNMAGLLAPGGVMCIVQSVPWMIDKPHHFSQADSLDDILRLVPISVEWAAPVADASAAETVILARKA